MKKLIQALNTKQVFHTVNADNSVEVLKQPADMGQEGKDMLKKYYGLNDFSVPKEFKDPFNNQASKMVEEMKKQVKRA